MAQARRSGTAFGTWPRSSPRVGCEARQKLDRARRARGEVVLDIVHRFSAQCLWYGRMARWRKSVAWAGPNRPKPTNEMYGRKKPKATNPNSACRRDIARTTIVDSHRPADVDSQPFASCKVTLNVPHSRQTLIILKSPVRNHSRQHARDRAVRGRARVPVMCPRRPASHAGSPRGRLARKQATALSLHAYTRFDPSDRTSPARPRDLSSYQPCLPPCPEPVPYAKGSFSVACRTTRMLPCAPLFGSSLAWCGCATLFCAQAARRGAKGLSASARESAARSEATSACRLST